MLRELLALFRDRGPRATRRFGHEREAVAIAARHRRCREAWEPHLAAVKSLALDAADTAPGRDTAVVLGSGLCLDVPVDGLCARFRQVVLVDAHHPRTVRAMARKRPGLRLVTADVTGMADAAVRAAKRGTGLPDPVPVPPPCPGCVRTSRSRSTSPPSCPFLITRCWTAGWTRQRSSASAGG